MVFNQICSSTGSAAGPLLPTRVWMRVGRRGSRGDPTAGVGALPACSAWLLLLRLLSHAEAAADGHGALKRMERAVLTECQVYGGPLPLPSRLLHGLGCCCPHTAGQTWHTPWPDPTAGAPVWSLLMNTSRLNLFCCMRAAAPSGACCVLPTAPLCSGQGPAAWPTHSTSSRTGPALRMQRAQVQMPSPKPYVLLLGS